MHAAGTLQVVDITAAPPVEKLTDNVYTYFFQLGEIPFAITILKEGENCFPTVFRHTNLNWSCNQIVISSLLIQVIRNLKFIK